MFAEPNEIADRYHKALGRLPARSCKQVVLESAVDYHRVTIDEDYEQVLMRFLIGRAQAKGRAMSFLQPWLLVALPLVALPIIIHLINQRRFQTIHWAAMMFLLAANRMSRGYARLRQWLILLFRMLAIAGLVFAVSRPLASGWLGLAAGGRPTRRSCCSTARPACSSSGAGAASRSSRPAAQQLAQTLSTLGSDAGC